jgi:hypothetical protein
MRYRCVLTRGREVATILAVLDGGTLASHSTAARLFTTNAVLKPINLGVERLGLYVSNLHETAQSKGIRPFKVTSLS